MRRGDFSTADLRLPEWTDGMPGHTVIGARDLAASFGLCHSILDKAIDRGDFPNFDSTPHPVNLGSRGCVRFALVGKGKRENKRYWHLSTVRARLAGRRESVHEDP